MSQKYLMLIGGAALAGWFVWSRTGAALDAINPANNHNLISEAVNDATFGATRDTSLGSWFYDALHGEYDPNG